MELIYIVGRLNVLIDEAQEQHGLLNLHILNFIRKELIELRKEIICEIEQAKIKKGIK